MFFYNMINAGLVIAWLAFFLSCNERISKPGESASEIKINTDSLYYFDINKKSNAQPYDPSAAEGDNKFVQVEVVNVTNPKKYPVTFEVYYQIIHSEKIFLGSFSLYPADNPGKFIVPTSGKLTKPGSIILSLLIPGNLSSADTITVTTKKMKLVSR